MLGKKQNGKKRMRGASIAEFIIAFPIVIILALCCLQLMLMYRAKLAHNYAVQEAVRIGAMSNGRIVPRYMTDFLTAQLGGFAYAAIVKRTKNPKTGKVDATVVKGSNMPGVKDSSGPPQKTPATDSKGAAPGGSWLDKAKGSYKNKQPGWVWNFLRGMMRYGDSSVLQGYINGITPFYVGRNGHTNVAHAQIEAYRDAMWNSCIVYHSPTQAAFLESGVIELQGLDYGVLKLPADYMRFRTPLGVWPDDAGISMKDSKLKGDLTNKSIQENTILSIEIMWSYPLDVPIANSIIIGLIDFLGMGAENGLQANFNRIAFDRGRFPFTASASARAQGSLHWHPFYPLGGMAPPAGTGGNELFDLVVLTWNAIVNQLGNSFDPAEPQIGFCLANLDWVDGDTSTVSPHWWGEEIDKN